MEQKQMNEQVAAKIAERQVETIKRHTPLLVEKVPWNAHFSVEKIVNVLNQDKVSRFFGVL